MQEYANKLENWINISVNSVLNRRHAIIRQDIGGNDDAANMLGSLTTRRETARGTARGGGINKIPKLELSGLASSRKN